MPKCLNINASKSLLLDVPAKSIGFYVIPNANVPTCCCNERNHLTTPEIIDDQYEIESNTEKQIANMDVLAKVIENELLTYEEYIKNPAEWRRLLHNKMSEAPETRNINEVPEDLKRVIFERAKQKKALELEEKSKQIKRLLMERAKNEETKAKILSDIEKLKATEVEQAIDELINKNSDASKLREKRSLVTSNEDDVSWMQHEETMNAVPRPTRRIQNNLEERISLDPVYENGQEGGCACRRTGKCNCGKNYTNMFLKQMLQVLNSDQKQVETKIENYEGTHQNIKYEEVKEMKNLVNELKSIVTSMKYIEAQNKSNQFYYKQQKDDTDDNNVGEMIKVNLIPKDRMKRNTEENNDVLREPTNGVSRKRTLSRKKRAATTIKEDEVNTIIKPDEDRTITLKPKEEKPETPKSKEEKIEDIDQHYNTKYKLLQRKLLHQEKLEHQIESYLEKIRQHKVDLKNELEKSATSKQAHVKKHVKREIWDSDDDEITDYNETNKIENNILDITKENDMFLNEISKEGKDLPNFVKENEEATYKLKVKTVPKKRVNKIIKMFENGSNPQNNAAIVKPKKKITKAPSTEIPSTSSTLKETSEIFHDAHDEHIATTTTMKTEEANDDGFVDEAFKTLSQCLSEFHRKIVDFLRFLSP